MLNELGKLLNESVDKENCFPHRQEHKLSKRLSNSIRKARRLSSYGYRKEIFGRALTFMRSTSNINSPFPLFIHQILVILLHEAQSSNVEGLLRTSASKNKLDETYKVINVLNVNDQLPHDLCNSHNVFILADLLKRFLREIPETLLSQKVWNLMIGCCELGKHHFCNNLKKFRWHGSVVGVAVLCFDLEHESTRSIVHPWSVFAGTLQVSTQYTGK